MELSEQDKKRFREIGELLAMYNAFFTARCHRHKYAPGQTLTRQIADLLLERVGDRSLDLVARLERDLPKADLHLWQPLILCLLWEDYLPAAVD